MRRLRGLPARFRRLPARTRLAVASAGLTFAILAVFAVSVAVFSAHQVHSRFDSDLRGMAADLQQKLVQPTLHGPQVFNDPHAVTTARAGGGVIWISLPKREPITTPGAPSLGQPRTGIRDSDGYRVATRPVRSPGGATVGFFQYGKPRDDADHTIVRIRLFLLIGLIAGTALAFFAVRTLARRTMPPIPA